MGWGPRGHPVREGRTTAAAAGPSAPPAPSLRAPCGRGVQAGSPGGPAVTRPASHRPLALGTCHSSLALHKASQSSRPRSLVLRTEGGSVLHARTHAHANTRTRRCERTRDVCAHTRMCAHGHMAHACSRAHICRCACKCGACVCMHVCSYARMHADTCKRVRRNVCTHGTRAHIIDVYMHTRGRAHTHTPPSRQPSPRLYSPR